MFLSVSIATAIAAAINPPPASATPSGTEDLIESVQTRNGLSGFHGVKPGDMDSVVAGIRRPSGTAGNDDADWKAFYLAESVPHAAEYTVGLNGMSAGGIVEVTLPIEVQMVTLRSPQNAGESPNELVKRQMAEVRERFEIPANDPLMDSLGKKNIVLKLNDGTGRNEIIIPWEMAEAAHAEKVIEFKSGTKGVDQAYQVMHDLNCNSRTRRSTSSSGRRGCSLINWNEVREKAKENTNRILGDQEHVDRLPRRSASGMGLEEAREAARLTHAKVRAETNSSHLAGSSIGVATWAFGLAQTLRDQNATELDKITAATAIIPGIGPALGIVNGIDHKDPRAIITNSVILAALVAAQVVPVVGELVDTALIAEQVVEVLVDVFERAIAEPPLPPSLQQGEMPILPVPQISVECNPLNSAISWKPSRDLPRNAKIIVQKRGGSVTKMEPGALTMPGEKPPLFGLQTYDIFYRAQTDQGKILKSKKRAVAETSSFLFWCDTDARVESW